MADGDKNKGGRPFKFTDPVALKELCDAYFETAQGKEKPTVTGLALHLDTTRQTLVDYANVDHYSEDIDEEVRTQLIDTIKKAKGRVELKLEEHLYGNSVAGAIFNLKNNFEWRDRTETDITSGGDKLPAAPDAALAAGFVDYLKQTTQS